MSFVQNALTSINEGREAISNAAPNSAEIMESGLNLCHSAIQSCKGSGSVMTDLQNTAKAYGQLAASGVAAPLRFCTNLATAHPINATKALIEETWNATKAMGSIAASPLALTNSTLSTGTRISKEAAKKLVESPLLVYQTTMRGANSVLNLLGPTSGTSSPADSPPPPAASSSASPAVL